ncbi:MAG: hypothetical protein IPJ66_17330 [Bacteroidetes bacterium]|nr:hypothetical protein [Bacteroidota bacterium]
MGGSDLDGLYSIHSTSDNGYIVCGYTRSNDGDVSGNHSAGFNTDAWVVKLDANGTILWQKCLGGLSGESFYSIIETPDGGYLCGGSNYAVGGDVTVNYGNYDFWVTKLSSAGILQWQKSYGGSGEDKAKSIIHLSDGNYLVGGNSASNDIDVSGNHGNMDNWVIKINASGTILWQKCFGGTGTEDPHSLAELADGSLMSSGITNSTNGDVSGNHGNYDLWVTKFSNSGTLIWQKCIGGSNSEYGGDIVLSMDGGMVIAGSTASNNGDVSGFHGSMDGWLVKLDGNGNILWNDCYGGSAQDEAGGILQSGDGNYSFVGSTSSTNGDVSNNQGSNDVWMVVLKNPDIISNGSLTTCSGNTITLTATAGTSFLWNNGSNASSITVNETGTYQVTADECFLSDPVEVIFNPCDFNVLTRNFIEGYYLGNSIMVAAINPVSEPLKCDTAFLELHSINPPYALLYKET